MADNPLASTLGFLLLAVLIVFGGIALGTIIRAYTESVARRISTRRISVGDRPRELEPNPLPVVLLIVAALVLVAMLMG